MAYGKNTLKHSLVVEIDLIPYVFVEMLELSPALFVAAFSCLFVLLI